MVFRTGSLVFDGLGSLKLPSLTKRGRLGEGGPAPARGTGDKRGRLFFGVAFEFYYTFDFFEEGGGENEVV